MTRRTHRAGRLAVLATVALVLASGCRFEGPGSLPLPFRAGTGAGSYEISVIMSQIANLAPNAEVKVNDLTVGTVTRAAFDNWNARLTVALEGDVTLPANATASVGQKSLLGAVYLELDAPPQDAAGRLRDGDVIPLERTGRFPETEEVLAALSVVLNGGGLNQIATITRELNATLGGRQEDLRALIDNLGVFVGSLEAQRGDIIRAIEGIDRLSATLAAQRPVIEEALDTIPAGLRALSEERDNLITALTTLGDAGEELAAAVRESGDGLVANLKNLQPILGNLATAGEDFTQSVQYVGTFPFPSRTMFPSVAKGDAANIYVMVDLRPEILARNLLGGFTLPDAGLISLPPLAAPNAGTGELLPEGLAPDGLLDGVLPGPTGPPGDPAAPAQEAPADGGGDGGDDGDDGGLLPDLLGGDN